MQLTYEDIKKGKLLFKGKYEKCFSFQGREVFVLNNGDTYQRQDSFIIPLIDFYKDVLLYQIENFVAIIFIHNDMFTIVKKVEIIESKIINEFSGFDDGNKYELENGQTWQQIDGSVFPCTSSGFVKILNNKIIKIDNWDIYPRVIKIQ